MKNAGYLLCIILFLFSLSGCNDDENKVSPAKLIGLSLPDQATSYTEAVISEMKTKYKEAGFTLIVTDGNGKIENQKTQLDALLNLPVKSIIVVAGEGDLSEDMAKIKNSNIPVINIIQPLKSTEVANAFVLNNNKQAGVITAQEMNRILPTGGNYQALYLTGDKSDSDRNQFLEGLTESLDPSISRMSNPLSCVDSLSALSRAKTILSRNVSACLAFDDVSAVAFVKALEESGKTLNDSKIVVFSGSPLSKQLLKEGKISAVAAQSPISLAGSTIDVCLKLLNNTSVETNTLVNAGMLTPDNIGEYDADIWQ